MLTLFNDLVFEGGGELNKSMGRGVAGLRTVNYHENRPAYYAPLVERKIDQEAALVNCK